MAVSHDLAPAARSAALACTRYLMQAGVQSSRTSHLNRQVLGCMARGQLDPDVVEASLRTFGEKHVAELASGAQAAMMRFAERMTEARIMPMAADAESIARDLVGVAEGEVTVGQSRRGYRAAVGRTIASELMRAAEHWFEFLTELDRLEASAASQVLLELLRAATPIGFSGEVVRLTGGRGGVASSEMWLENEDDRSMTIRCSVGDLRRADGVNAAFRPESVIEPAELRLGARQAGRVTISLSLDPDRYQAGVSYVGALDIARNGEPALALPLVVALER